MDTNCNIRMTNPWLARGRCELCMVWVIRSEVAENCARLDYTQSVVVIPYRLFGQLIGPICNGQERSWSLKMEPIGHPETSVSNYLYTLRGSAKHRRSHRCMLLVHLLSYYQKVFLWYWVVKVPYYSTNLCTSYGIFFMCPLILSGAPDSSQHTSLSLRSCDRAS